MPFGEPHSSSSLSARQSSRVLHEGCSPSASSRKRKAKTKEKNSFTLCVLHLQHEEEMSLPRVAYFLVSTHGVLQLSFGAGALQPGRARCEWKALVSVCGDGISSVGAEKAWG